MLVPFADAINHANESIINYNLFHKNLHLSSNKIYLHETDFETFEYDTNSSKQDINISRIFKDDQQVNTKLVNGKFEETQTEPYPDYFQRFKNVVNNPETKFPDHGSQLWGLGYVSSENEEDDDMNDMEEDEAEATMAVRVADKILKGESIDEDKEVIYDSQRLRDIYNNRWWNSTLDQTYFAMYNSGSKNIKKN